MLAIHSLNFSQFTLNWLKIEPWVALQAPPGSKKVNLKIKWARQKIIRQIMVVSYKVQALLRYLESCGCWVEQSNDCACSALRQYVLHAEHWEIYTRWLRHPRHLRLALDILEFPTCGIRIVCCVQKQLNASSVLWLHTHWLISCGQNSAEMLTMDLHCLGSELAGGSFCILDELTCEKQWRWPLICTNMIAISTTCKNVVILTSSCPWPLLCGCVNVA